MAWKKILTRGGVSPLDLNLQGATLASGQSGEALIVTYDGASGWGWDTGRAAGSQFLHSSDNLSGSTNAVTTGGTAFDGDLHISDSNGDMYQWSGATWEFVTNLQGPSGVGVGIPGPTGPSGAQGDQGVPGNDGEDGLDGNVGPTGDTGASISSINQDGINDTGASYDMMATAADGSISNIGIFFVPAGPQGIQGNDGDQGEQGIQGEDGDQGEQGIQGEDGDQGEQGIQGETGPSGTNGSNGTTFVPNVLSWSEADSNLTINFTSGSGATTAVSGEVSINSTQSQTFAVGGASGFKLDTNNDGTMSVLDSSGTSPVDIIVADVHLGNGSVIITSGGIVEVADAFQAVNKDSITAATGGATVTELTPSDMLSIDTGFQVYRGAFDITDQASIDGSIASTSDLYWSEAKGYWKVKIPEYTGNSVTAGNVADSVNYDLHMSFTTSDPSVTDPTGATAADVDALNRLNTGGFFIGGDDSIWVKTA